MRAFNSVLIMENLRNVSSRSTKLNTEWTYRRKLDDCLLVYAKVEHEKKVKLLNFKINYWKKNEFSLESSLKSDTSGQTNKSFSISTSVGNSLSFNVFPNEPNMYEQGNYGNVSAPYELWDNFYWSLTTNKYYTFLKCLQCNENETVNYLNLILVILYPVLLFCLFMPVYTYFYCSHVQVYLVIDVCNQGLKWIAYRTLWPF